MKAVRLGAPAGKVRFRDYAEQWMLGKTAQAPTTVERAAEIRAATSGDVSRLVVPLLEPRYRALILTAAYAGCRWGELAGLRQRNLGLDGARLTVVEQAIDLAPVNESSGPRRPPPVDGSSICRRVSSRRCGSICRCTSTPAPTAWCSPAPTERRRGRTTSGTGIGSRPCALPA